MNFKLATKRSLIVTLLLILVGVNTTMSLAYWASNLGDPDDVITIADTTIGDWDYCVPIYTAQQFYDFATSSTSLTTDNYCLKNDIDFSSFTWEYLASHVTNQFHGTFDGNDYTLSNISIETSVSGTTYLSLFSRMDGGTIKNVKIDNYGMGFSTAYYNSSAIQAGIFAGEVSGLNNHIENITITDSDVIGSSINGAGGLFGQIQGNADLTIKNIKARNLTVLNSSKRVGGLVSRANSGTGTIIVEDIDIQGNFAAGNATSNTGSIFGTFRELNGTISRVVAEYDAEGSINLTDGTITFKSNKYVGGFVGNNNNNNSVMTINDSFYTGALYNTITSVGSVLGRKKAAITLNNVYYSNVYFVNGYVASTSSTVINGTVVNAQSMPSLSWWNSFYVNYSAANSLWTQDASGRPELIR